MQLGDCGGAVSADPSPLDAALDTLDHALTDLIATVESGGLDQLDATAKLAVLQRFETLRNKLPVVDHGLIADAEASDLPGSHCFSNMTQFLVRILKVSRGEAASGVRAAAAVGPRSSMLGEKLEPQLPQLAALQRDGQVSAAKVAIVERAMHQLTRPGLDSRAVQTAEQLFTEHAPTRADGLAALRTPGGRCCRPGRPRTVDDQLQQDRRHLELKQRRDRMWRLTGTLTGTVGTQLNAILNPLSRPHQRAGVGWRHPQDG